MAKIIAEHGALRSLLLGVLAVSMAGIGLELLLLEHTESRIQLVPLVTLAVGFVATLVVMERANRAVLLTYRSIMAGFVAVGLLGLWYHYKGNVEFELEMTPELGGMELFLASIRGATPALAPGAIAQLGLFGLAFTFRHPRLAPLSKNNRPENDT